MKRYEFPESLCQYYEADEVDAIIVEKDKEIEALKLLLQIAESRTYPDYELADANDVLREQLRASNEALVAESRLYLDTKLELDRTINRFDKCSNALVAAQDRVEDLKLFIVDVRDDVLYPAAFLENGLEKSAEGLGGCTVNILRDDNLTALAERDAKRDKEARKKTLEEVASLIRRKGRASRQG